MRRRQPVEVAPLPPVEAIEQGLCDIDAGEMGAARDAAQPVAEPAGRIARQGFVSEVRPARGVEPPQEGDPRLEAARGVGPGQDSQAELADALEAALRDHRAGAAAPA